MPELSGTNKHCMTEGNQNLHLTHDVVELVFRHPGEARWNSVAGNLLSRHSFLHNPTTKLFQRTSEPVKELPNTDVYLGLVWLNRFW